MALRLWLCLLIVAAPVLAADDSILDPRLSFSLHEVGLPAIAAEIERQTGYRVTTAVEGAARPDSLSGAERLSMAVQDVSLRALLNLLETQGYHVDDRGGEVAISGQTEPADLAPEVNGYPYRVTLTAVSSELSRDLAYGAYGPARRVTRLTYRIEADTEVLSRALLGARAAVLGRVGSTMASAWAHPRRPFEPIGPDGRFELIVPWSGQPVVDIGPHTLAVAYLADAREQAYTFDPYGPANQVSDQPGAEVTLVRTVEADGGMDAEIIVSRPMSGAVAHFLERASLSGSGGPVLGSVQLPLDSGRPGGEGDVGDRRVTGIDGRISRWDDAGSGNTSVWLLPRLGPADNGSMRLFVPVNTWIDTAADPLAPVVLLESAQGRTAMAVGLRSARVDTAQGRLAMHYVARVLRAPAKAARLRVGLVDFGRRVSYQPVQFGATTIGAPPPMPEPWQWSSTSEQEAPSGG